jgi:hypothetical protein
VTSYPCLQTLKLVAHSVENPILNTNPKPPTSSNTNPISHRSSNVSYIQQLKNNASLSTNTSSSVKPTAQTNSSPNPNPTHNKPFFPPNISGTQQSQIASLQSSPVTNSPVSPPPSSPVRNFVKITPEIRLDMADKQYLK